MAAELAGAVAYVPADGAWAVFAGILEGNWTRCPTAGEAATTNSAANRPDLSLGSPTTVPLRSRAHGKGHTMRGRFNIREPRSGQERFQPSSCAGVICERCDMWILGENERV